MRQYCATDELSKAALATTAPYFINSAAVRLTPCGVRVRSGTASSGTRALGERPAAASETGTRVCEVKKVTQRSGAATRERQRVSRVRSLFLSVRVLACRTTLLLVVSTSAEAFVHTHSRLLEYRTLMTAQFDCADSQVELRKGYCCTFGAQALESRAASRASRSSFF